jgi:hypothetical protein
MNRQQLSYFDSETTVEILTFNMNKNPLALGEVMSSLKKNTALIVICVQESNQWLATCQRNICSFLEDYKCKDAVQQGNPVAGYLQMFILQHKNVHENFRFSHKLMPFSFDFRNVLSNRPWKGAVFLKCESRKFRTPFVFVGAHFHAHEGPKYVTLRENDFEQIQSFLQNNYSRCDWCLFGDLNFRSSETTTDEFQPYFTKYNITESSQFDEPNYGNNTYKVDVNHRNEFDKHRTASRTDRICHNKTDNVQILQYGIVKRSADPSTPAGAGSDHYPVFELFRILHRTRSLSSPFLISYLIDPSKHP